MQHGRIPCRSFDNGHACVGCPESINGPAERRRRARQYVGEVAPLGWLSPASLVQNFVRPVALRLPGSKLSVGQPGWPAETGDDLRDARGQPPPALEPPFTLDLDGPESRPLTNDAAPEPSSDRPPNEYARRRAAMVAAMSEC